MILGADPRRPYLAQQAAIDQAIARVLAGGWYILGEEVAAFEQAFARYCEVGHAVGVANGTDAIQLALMALGVGPGDEVISVSQTAVATVVAIEQTGATPVLVDVCQESYTIDPACVAERIGERTRAIVAVHLYGQPVDWDGLQHVASAHHLPIVEDCAQAHGARYGTHPVGSLGVAGCFSCYPTKNLGALGDAGIVVTDDGRLADRLRMLRQYGWRTRYVSEIKGCNSRLDPLQAAVLNVKLPQLDEGNRRRRAIAARYRDEIQHPQLIHPAERPGTTHVYHQYVIRCRERDRLRRHLHAQDIRAQIHYPLPVHRQPAYRALDVTLPVTERLAGELLSLPVYPELSDGEVQRVIDGVNSFFEAL